MGPCCGRKYGPSPNRKPTPEEEEEFQMELQKMFDKRGNQGFELAELQEKLAEAGLMQTIQKDKMEKLLKDADTDGDTFVTYSELMIMYKSKLSTKEKWAFKTFVGPFLHNILPWKERQDFLANYDCRPPPIFMIIISIIELSVFIWYAVELANAGNPVTADDGFPEYSPLVYRATRRYEAWRFLSYMLIHDGYMHLFPILLGQLVLGTPLEIVHEWWRVVILYFCGVIGGSLVHSVTDHGVDLVGASGGMYAIIGAHVGSVIVNWKEMNYMYKCNDEEYRWWRCFVSAPFRLTIMFLLVGVDTGLAIFRRFFTGGSRVGISAHIGGLITGILIGVPLLRNVNELPWEKMVGKVTMSFYVACVIFAIIFNGLYQGYPPTDWTPCCGPANNTTPGTASVPA